MGVGEKVQIERRIFCVWFGEQMSSVRLECLTQLKKVAETEVLLVGEDNLADWIVAQRPLPPGFEFLLPIQKADYLRAYLTAIHGGGYSDIKKTSESWQKSFDLAISSQNEVIGYALPHPSLVASFGLPPTVARKLSIWRKSWWMRLYYRRSYDRLLGAGAFIIRPMSPFATEYLERVEEKVERLSIWLETEATREQRRKVLSQNFNIYSQEISGYPLHWGSMSMDILHRMSFDFSEKISFTLPTPILEDYR
jgi:hypothetical protein